MSSPSNIVVRAPNWLGDHVMAASFYAGLREAYPQAKITLVVREAIRGLETANGFDGVEGIPSNLSVRALARKLASQEFDLAISLPASASSALAFWWSRIPLRVGFAEPAARPWYTDSLPWKGREAGRHKASLYLDLLEFITARRFPRLSPTPAIGRGRRPRVVVGPGASIALREWTYFPEFFAQAPRLFPNVEWVAVGGPSDEKWKSVLSRSDTAHAWKDHIGQTSLIELVRLCEEATLVIANDTGLAHVAASVAGTPTLVLFGPGDPDYVAPIGERVEVVRVKGLPCSPCEKPYCRAPFGYQRCLRALSLETVLTKLHHLL